MIATQSRQPIRDVVDEHLGLEHVALVPPIEYGFLHFSVLLKRDALLTRPSLTIPLLSRMRRADFTPGKQQYRGCELKLRKCLTLYISSNCQHKNGQRGG